MEYLLENILNMVGFLVGLCIGLASYLGYKNTGSPVLFRMSVAFLSIAIGFFVIWMGYVAEDLILQQGHIDRTSSIPYHPTFQIFLRGKLFSLCCSRMAKPSMSEYILVRYDSHVFSIADVQAAMAAFNV